MDEERDTIEVLTLHLRIPTEKENALTVCDGYYRRIFQPTIEEVFDTYPKTCDTVIPKLAIDLGEVTEEEIPDRLRAALKSALDDRFPQKECEGTIPQKKGGRGARGRLEHEGFLEYIETGHRTCRAANQHSPFECPPETCMEWLLSPDTTDRLVGIVKRDKRCFYRLTDELSEEQLLRLLKNISLNMVRRERKCPAGQTDTTPAEIAQDSMPEEGWEIPTPSHAPLDSIGKDAVSCLIEHLLFEENLPNVANANHRENRPHNTKQQGETAPAPSKDTVRIAPAATAQQQLRKSSPQVVDENPATSPTLPESMETNSPSSHIEGPLLGRQSLVRKGEPTGRQESQEHQTDPVAAKGGVSERNASALDDKLREELAKRFREERERYLRSIAKVIEMPEEKTRLHIDNAGLMLLNPFFQTLFQRLGYLEENSEFKSLEMQTRAVHVLHSIAYGFDTEHDAQDLTLCKVACGLSPQFPVEKDFRPTTEEKTEVEEMLATAKGYWHIMKGTTIDGLQQSFLQRPGTVERDDSSWIVRVEGNSIDILLEDLPWGFKTYSAPWADVLIYVEWQKEI